MQVRLPCRPCIIKPVSCQAHTTRHGRQTAVVSRLYLACQAVRQGRSLADCLPAAAAAGQMFLAGCLSRQRPRLTPGFALSPLTALQHTSPYELSIQHRSP